MAKAQEPIRRLGQVVVICMLPDLELRGLRDVMPAHGARRRQERDGVDGEGWLVDIDGTPTEIVVQRIEGQGNTESAIATLGILYRLAPRYVLLCGIAGGMQMKKVGLGDVVIASDVDHRGFNKVFSTDDSPEPQFRRVAYATAARPGGARLVDEFFAKGQADCKAAGPWPAFKVAREKILSWDLVLDSERAKQALLKEVDGNYAAVEMEAGGFLKALAYYRQRFLHRPYRPGNGGTVDGLIVRGISDAAAEKAASDAGAMDWRRAAAVNAAEVTMRLIAEMRDADFGPLPGVAA